MKCIVAKIRRVTVNVNVNGDNGDNAADSVGKSVPDNIQELMYDIEK
jgi:hypothetical protein